MAKNTKPVPATLTKAAFARLLGISKARVTQLVTEGVIDGPSLIGAGRDARIHVETARRQLAERLDEGKVNGARDRAAPLPGLTLHQARTLRAREDVQRAAIAKDREAIELAALQGRMVDIESAVKLVAEEYTAVRSKLLSLPSKLATQLAAESLAPRCHEILTKAIHETLADLSADAEIVARAGTVN